MFEAYLVFEDGKRERLERFAALGPAADFVLKLADDLGLRPYGDGHGPPVAVEIAQDDQLVISVSITRGGLVLHKGDAKAQAT